MRFQNIIFIILISIVFTGCGSCEQAKPKNNNQPANISKSNSPDNSQTPNTNVNDNVNGDQPTPIPEAQAARPEEKRVEAVTLKPTILAFCEAMRKGDNKGLEDIYSSNSLKSIRAEMRTERIATISEYLEGEAVGNKCEVVNEEIKGDTATAIVITETYPEGIPFKFVKENNIWKLTNESDALDSVDEQ